MNEWIKIDEQQAESSWMGYEDAAAMDALEAMEEEW